MVDQMSQMSQDIVNLNNKVNHLHRDLGEKANEIGQLKQDNSQLNAALTRTQGMIPSGGQSDPRSGMGALVNMKTMAPKVFHGKAEESYRTWAKKTRAYCNASRPGFKKFLQWIERQETEINVDDMRVDWRYKESAAEVLYDFLMIYTDDSARIIVERYEDNGPEAWRQLARRYDPIGETYAIDQMNKLMNVSRCKSMIELPTAISRWEKAHANYVSRAGGSQIPEEWKVPILFNMIPTGELDKIKLQFKYTRPEEKNYHSLSRALMELAGEKQYDQAQKSSSDPMDLSLVNAEEKYSASEWEEFMKERYPTQAEWDEWEADLDYLGGGKGKGKARKGKGKGKGCHWCGKEGHEKAACQEFAAWKKKKDEERAAKGLPPYVPKGAGRGNGGKSDKPLKSLDAEDAKQKVGALDRDYVGFGMLDAASDAGSIDALDVDHQDEECEDYEPLSNGPERSVSGEVAPPTDEPAAAKHGSYANILTLEKNESDDDDDDDDGDFRELPGSNDAGKNEVQRSHITGPKHFPPVDWNDDDPMAESDPWKGPKTPDKPVYVPSVPQSWNSAASSQKSEDRETLNWDDNESVASRMVSVYREANKIRVKMTGETNESKYLQTPPGLISASKMDWSAASSCHSVYQSMINKSVETDDYRSADVPTYKIDSPRSESSSVDMGTQTELTLSVAAESVVWTPTIGSVVESRVVGSDAKIDLAVKAQERDIIPEERSEEASEEVSESAVADAELAPPPEPRGKRKLSMRKRKSVRAFRVQQSGKEQEDDEDDCETADLLAVDAEKIAKKAIIGKVKLGCSELCECADANCGELLSTGPSAPARSKGVEKAKMKRGITMDTGAHHNVMPKRMVGRRPIRSSKGSRAGMKYVGAGGERISNEGEVDFPFETIEGHKQSMIFQIAEVNKPLGSVAYFVDRNYRVVYDKNMTTGEDLSYMIFKPTRTTYRFRRDRNVWILDAIVDIADLFADFSRQV